jgi:PhnB protein
MSETYAPDYYNRVVPYLTLEGAAEILDFLVDVFQGEVLNRSNRRDGKLGHAAVRIGDSIVELSEFTERFGPMPGAIHIYVPDVDLAHRRAVDRGAKVIHEPMDMDYGERASAVQDSAGNHWYIATFSRA